MIGFATSIAILSRYNSTGMDPWDERGGASHGPGSAHRMSADEIRAQQQMIIDEQDQGLDEISKALRRQRDLGLAIQDEVGEHNGKHFGLIVH